MSEAIIAYYEVMKPKTVYLLVFTAFGGMVASGGWNIPWLTVLAIVVAIFLGSGGANVLTCYLDRDIDAVMVRTGGRPLPSGRISPPEKALYYGIALSILSILLAFVVSPLSSLFMTLGIVDNVIVYSRFLKRRNPANIILGGFSGGMPILVGYAALPMPAKPWMAAILMAAIVVLWIPSHIWSLALRWREDYARANVPMLPIVVSEKAAVKCIASTTILMAIFSLAPYPLGLFSIFYFAVAGGLAVVMLILNFWLIVKPTKERAWIVFKFSSPYLALLFIAMIVDTLLYL